MKGQSARSDPTFPAGHETLSRNLILATICCLSHIAKNTSVYSMIQALISMTDILEKNSNFDGFSLYLSGKFQIDIRDYIHGYSGKISYIQDGILLNQKWHPAIPEMES
jgi:hypothetical protein